MLRWLAFLIYGRDHVEFIEGLNEYITESGQQMLNAARRARNNPPPRSERPLSRFEEDVYVARHRKPPLLTSYSGDPLWERMESRRKRALLELEIENAEWILKHDNRRTALKKRVDRARIRASQAGRSTETLDALSAHLRGGHQR